MEKTIVCLECGSHRRVELTPAGLGRARGCGRCGHVGWIAASALSAATPRAAHRRERRVAVA